MSSTIIEESMRLVGYEAEWFEKDGFEVIGYSALHLPETPDFSLWEKLRDDGRLELLMKASIQVELFGCSSADGKATASMPKGTYRHTVCIEATKDTIYELLRQDGLFRMRFPASKWVSFHMKKERFFDGQVYHFWQDDPYGMIKHLGFQYNWDIAVHMDVFDRPDIGVFRPDDPDDRQRVIHFWMPVK